jgi:hypothetical protein
LSLTERDSTAQQIPHTLSLSASLKQLKHAIRFQVRFHVVLTSLSLLLSTVPRMPTPPSSLRSSENTDAARKRDEALLGISACVEGSQKCHQSQGHDGLAAELDNVTSTGGGPHRSGAGRHEHAAAKGSQMHHGDPWHGLAG